MALAIINSTRGSHPRVCNRAPEGRPERAVALSDSEVRSTMKSSGGHGSADMETPQKTNGPNGTQLYLFFEERSLEVIT